MATLDAVESMDEDFTGFDEEPVVVNPATGSAILDTDVKTDDTLNETDSDSGNLVIAERPEPERKLELKSVERSPRKRKPKVEDVTPTRTPSSRVRGQGLAYLLAMEKGGSKKQLAKAQAQVEAQDTSNGLLIQSTELEAAPPSEPVNEPELGVEKKKVKEGGKAVKEKDVLKGLKDNSKEKESSQGSLTPSDSPTPTSMKPPKSATRKSYSAVNISSPALKEPFKEGWRREVVYRATVDPGTKTLCDVYYYAPDGKKLRSGREVSDYLDKVDSPFSVENFTFFKEPIGMDAHQEILRYAKTRRDDVAGEKLINKKEKALKAREDELRRNLQELGEDVAAITGHVPAKEAETSIAESTPEAEATSPLQRKKRGGKVEKQLKIKLWGKGLRSKENAEPARKEEATEGEDDTSIAVTTPVEKTSPSQRVPDDISHLFTAHSPATTSKNRSLNRGQKSTPATLAANSSPGSGQQLELINGKRFISIGPSPEPVHTDEHVATKRLLSSPSAPRQSPKRLKLTTSISQSTMSIPTLGKTKIQGFFMAEQFNNFVSHAYHGLLHVFKFLTVQELMVAAGVCKLWRDLALHHSHWRLVRLKNSRIYDWSLFASHLRRAGTQQLDMRKMLFVTSPEETWTNLERASSNLSEILRIDLCKCPSEVLESIAKHCLRLQYIDAQFISSQNIRFESLGNLQQLEELKVRSVQGLAIDDGFEAFSQLKSLKSLNLTTLTNLKSSELTHLTHLSNLESMEIGDCVLWTEATDYDILGQLTHLRHLRLEKGPPNNILDFLEISLKSMTSLQHLELINFTIDAPLDGLQLACLKRLLIIPRYNAETLSDTMRHLFNCVASMVHLQQMSWVVTDEILSASADGKLPLPTVKSEEGESGEERISLDDLQNLLRTRLPQTSVHLLRLPEYATHRYSLSISQED